jgi:hypothetical protein
MPGWSAQGYRIAAAWDADPVAKAERDAKFLGPGSERHCQAVLPGKRCTRFAIRETGNRLCLRHAGPTAARLYRENCRKLVESGRYPWDKWLKEEAQRARTRTRNHQARKPGGWASPGLTVWFSPEIEDQFQRDVAPRLGLRDWDGVPDYFRDRLRWDWRRFVLDQHHPDAWIAKARAILADLTAHGPLPEGRDLHHAGYEPHLILVEGRSPPGSWRRRKIAQAELDRAILPGPVKPKAPAPKPLDDALLQAHGYALHDVLARVEPGQWTAVLLAYDRWSRDPADVEKHRAYTRALGLGR